MTDQIKLLSNKMNVSGAEKQLSNFIVKTLSDQGFCPKVDNLGNVILKNENFENSKLMICAPLDNPGFLTLYSEKSKAYLSYTDKKDENIKNTKEVIDQEGEIYKAKSSKEYPDYVCVTKNAHLIGEPFRIPSVICEKDGKISGKFICRYALQSVLLDLAGLTRTHNISLCFTTGFHTPSKSENCLARKHKPENMILLGFTEAKESHCILLAKDGKSFSDRNLMKIALLSAEKCKIGLIKKAQDAPITKAETIAIPGGIKVLSLALPCQNLQKNEEVVLIGCLAELKEILKEIAYSI